jgi:diguanylate cyclase (GGDEF)-like protein
MGVLALSAPREDWPQAKAVLRVIAQIGALAIHDVDAYAQMKVTADVDGLTLLYNKRRMSQTLAEAILEAQQKMQSLAVFLFDLDHFKNYNDVNGHVAGDALLQVLARLVQDNTRRDNIIGRFGGEEFLVIFKGATAEHALQAAENLRTVIARHPFPFAGKQPLGLVSISGGVAEYPKDAMDSTGLLRAADAALYEAKRQGRNRVLVATPRYLSEDEPVIGSGVEDMDEDFDEAPPKKSASNG